jgi:hypothetical protein
MGWIKTEYSRFLEEEVIGVQYLPSNYSRTNDELIVSLRGGSQLQFSHEEANELWERLRVKIDEG